MGNKQGLREYVPDSCRELLEKSSTELRSDIPELARDDERMADVYEAVESLPSNHEIYQADSRDLSMVNDESVHLAVTSPPYFNIKDYGDASDGQLGEVDEYEEFNLLMDRVWSEVFNKLVPGGRLCIVVGDVLLSRSEHGRHRVLPLHATIQEHVTDIGFDNLAPIIWYKIGNATLEAGGNARFLGKPYEPGGVIKNDIEYILLFRKPGGYRSPSVEEKILSVIAANDHQRYFRQIWDDIKGASQSDHPATYPVELVDRLIRMFSFVGDTILDPFAGTGTTGVAAAQIGRNSINVELESNYVELATERIKNVGTDVNQSQCMSIDNTN